MTWSEINIPVLDSETKNLMGISEWFKNGWNQAQLNLWDQSFVFRIDRYSVYTGWIDIDFLYLGLWFIPDSILFMFRFRQGCFAVSYMIFFFFSIQFQALFLFRTPDYLDHVKDEKIMSYLVEKDEAYKDNLSTLKGMLIFLVIWLSISHDICCFLVYVLPSSWVMVMISKVPMMDRRFTVYGGVVIRLEYRKTEYGSVWVSCLESATLSAC